MVTIMDYYAFLDENNLVTEVIPGKDQGEDGVNWEQWYGEFRGQVCKRSRTDGFRKHYAGIGYTYDSVNDVFYAPQPYPSWTISAPTWEWQAPVPYPSTGGPYTWDETTQTWIS